MFSSNFTPSFLLNWFIVLSSYVCSRRLPFGGMAFSSAPNKATKRNFNSQPDYQIGNVDLSQKWIDLVEDGQVEATVDLSIDDTSDVQVKYGVRLSAKKEKCQEFVVQQNGSPCDRIQRINETLATLQDESAASSSSSSSSIKYEMDGDFVAQLQLVRTLRPPPSPGFSESLSSIAPPYKAETDSFVTGPLRLELRPLVETLKVDGLTTAWDLFHNVSPADVRGHFLLLPNLVDQDQNWRGQTFTANDCNDLVHLASSVRPFGSVFLGFNSVGAGASQNHIHAHAWPSPPLPLMEGYSIESDEELHGWNCYAVSRVKSILDFHDIADGKVECSYLDYPCFALQMSASSENLSLLAKALAASLDTLEDAPYNIGFLNRPSEEEDDDKTYVDAYLFARSRERSGVLPTLKLGISEMMGLFHAQSESEIELLASKTSVEEHGPITKVLQEISIENEEDIWTRIKENLMKLDDHL